MLGRRWWLLDFGRVLRVRGCVTFVYARKMQENTVSNIASWVFYCMRCKSKAVAWRRGKSPVQEFLFFPELHNLGFTLRGLLVWGVKPKRRTWTRPLNCGTNFSCRGGPSVLKMLSKPTHPPRFDYAHWVKWLRTKKTSATADFASKSSEQAWTTFTFSPFIFFG